MNLKLNSSLLCVFLCLSQWAYSHAENKVFITNKDGRSINVYLQSASATEVTVKLVKNSKVHTLKLANLDNATLKKIKKWRDAGGGLSEEFSIEFVSGKTARLEENGYDDRTLKLSPVVTVKNKNVQLETKPLEVTILTLGRPVNETSNIKIFQKEKHKLPALEGGGNHVINCEKFKTTYDTRGYKHGTKYLGYMVLVHDGKKVLASKSVPSVLAEKYDNIFLTLEKGKTYDKNLKKTGNTY